VIFEALRHRLGSLTSEQHGFTLIELVAAMTMLAVVAGGISVLFVSGNGTQATLSADFTAQSSVHLGLDKLRVDVHAACSETAQAATAVTLSGPPCDGSVLVTWCTRGSGSVYGLYRVSGSACTGGGYKWADYLTGGSIFSYLGPNVTAGSNALPRLHVDLTVNATPARTVTGYRVVDDLVFRNGPRA